MDTTTLEKHQKYTRDEFTNSEYYGIVLGMLRIARIKTSLDAGACTGEVTKVLKENIPTLAKCILIEPIKENFEYIKKNVPDSTVIHGALFYGSDTVSLAKIPNVGGATVCHSNYNIIENCKTVQLEDFGDIDFLKLDIEGAERNVIEHSEKIKNIPFIEIEFHHYDQELADENNRPAFISKHFPNHAVMYGLGKGKSSSVFLYDLRYFQL